MQNTQNTKRTIQLKHSFGVSSSKNSLQIFNNDRIFYIAGNNVVKLKIENSSQEFLKIDEKTQQIYCLTLSPNKTYLALGIKVNNMVMVNLFDPVSLSRNYLSIFSEQGLIMIHDIIFTNFKNQDYYFVIGETQNSTKLILQNYQSPDIEFQFLIQRKNFYKAMDFSHFNKKQFVIVGQNFGALYQVNENSIETIIPSLFDQIFVSSQNFNQVKFLKGMNNFLIADDQNNMFLFDSTGLFLKKIIPDIQEPFSYFETLREGLYIFHDNFKFTEYELDTEKYFLIPKIQEKSKIEQQKLNFQQIKYSEDIGLILALGNDQCLYLIKEKNNRQIFSIKKLSQDNHTGKIIGLSLAIMKPLFVTCSSDRQIKVWNYITQELQNTYIMNEDVISVHFHPSGLHIGIALSDKLIIQNIYPECLEYKKRGNKEIVLKNISCVQFSQGGDKIAIACGNPQLIYIYQFWDCQRIKNIVFKGHSGKISTLLFEQNDVILYSCGNDGIVYEWNLITGQRIEKITKGSPLNDIFIDQENEVIYLATEDKQSLVQLNEKEKLSFDMQVVYSKILMDSQFRLLIGGVKESQEKSGVVRIIKNLTKNEIPEYEDIIAHDGQGLTQMSMNLNDGYLITVGNDGMIFIFILNIGDNKNSNVFEDNIQYQNLTLITQIEIEELKSRKESLQNSKQDNDFQNKNLMTLDSLDDLIKQLKEKKKQKAITEYNIVEKYVNKKALKQREFEESLNQQLQTQEDQINQEESDYNKDIGKWSQKMEEKNKNFENMQKEQKEQLNTLQKDYQKTLLELKKKQEDLLKEKIKEKSKNNKEKEHVLQICQRKLDIIKKEANYEELQLQKKYEVSYKVQLEENQKIKNQEITMKKKIENFKQQIESYQEMYNEKEKSMIPQNKKLSELELLIEQQNEKLQKKKKLIDEKEKLIYKLKKETQELEKFKFVLEYTINNLEKEIKPKDLEIQELKKHIAAEDERLKNYNNTQSNLEQTVTQLEKNANVMNNKIKNSKEKLKRICVEIENTKNFIFSLVQDILSHRKLKEKLSKYTLKQTSEKQEINQIDIEYQNQIQYLETSVNNFRANIKKDSNIHKEDHRQYIQQNIELINEILILRKELKQMKTSEKPDTIKLRNQKKMRNIIGKKERDLSLQGKKNLIEEQDRQIKHLKENIQIEINQYKKEINIKQFNQLIQLKVIIMQAKNSFFSGAFNNKNRNNFNLSSGSKFRINLSNQGNLNDNNQKSNNNFLNMNNNQNNFKPQNFTNNNTQQNEFFRNGNNNFSNNMQQNNKQNFMNNNSNTSFQNRFQQQNSNNFSSMLNQNTNNTRGGGFFQQQNSNNFQTNTNQNMPKQQNNQFSTNNQSIFNNQNKTQGQSQFFTNRNSQNNNSTFFSNQNNQQNINQNQQGGFFQNQKQQTFFQQQPTQNNINNQQTQGQQYQNQQFQNQQSIFSQGNSQFFNNQNTQQNQSFFNQPQQQTSFFNNQQQQQNTYQQQIPNNLQQIQYPSIIISQNQINSLKEQEEKQNELFSTKQNQQIENYYQEKLNEKLQNLKQNEQEIKLLNSIKNKARRQPMILNLKFKKQENNLLDNLSMLSKKPSVLDNSFTRSNLSNLTDLQSTKIKINIKIQYNDKDFVFRNLYLSKNNTISFFMNYLLKKIPKPNNQIDLNSISCIMADGEILSSQTNISEIQDFENKEITLNINCDFQQSVSMQYENNSMLCPIDQLPKLTKEGYETEPTLGEIYRMTPDEIQNVENFQIWNDHGKIEWPGYTNLLKVNLDIDVAIKPMSFEVYPEDIYLTQKKKPDIGEKLNKEFQKKIKLNVSKKQLLIHRL